MAVTDFPTKVAVVVRDDLMPWQRLNVTAFLATGVASGNPDLIGEPYVDADGQRYHRACRQPILVYEATGNSLRTAKRRALERDVRLAIYLAEHFHTYNDDDNRREVARQATKDLNLVGLAFEAPHRQADQILRGLRRHP